MDDFETDEALDYVGGKLAAIHIMRLAVLAEAERLLRTPSDHRVARVVFSRNHVTLTDCYLGETEALSLAEAYEERMQKLAEEARKGGSGG